MFKKLLTASAVSMVLVGAAFAQSNPGFEGSSTAGWTPSADGVNNLFTGTLTSQAYGTSVIVGEDNYDAGGAFTGTTLTPFTVAAADAAYGSYFGVLNTGSLSSFGYTMNVLGGAAAAGDRFAFQLFSYEYDTANGYVDSAKFTFNGAAGGPQIVTWTTQDTQDQAGTIGASGWRQLFVPVGTTSIEVQLANGPLGDDGNQPVLALDYAAVTPVPEPESLALMMAGLGAVGFMSRRRKARAAQ